MSINWNDYPCEDFYDELVAAPGKGRPSVEGLLDDLEALGPDELVARQEAADVSIKEMGITFTVYSEEGGAIDRTWPFDIIPRIIPQSEWDRVEAGLRQRVQALNLFIDDLYHDQRIIKDGVFPAEVLAKSVNFRPQCVGVNPPLGIWAHICGSDLVRDGDGTLYVLEDNLRVPSGRLLHAGEPAGHQARLSRAVRALRAAAGRRLSVPALRYPGRDFAAPGGLSGSRGAHAGHLQLGLFRARLPGTADGLRAGRGARSLCR